MSIGLMENLATGSATSANIAWVVLGACLTLLATAGVWLVFWHPLHGGIASAGTRFVCLLLGMGGFYAVGFGLAMGGVSGSYAGLGPLEALNREWIPRGHGWGVMGLEGFFLAGRAYDPGVYALFLLQAAFFLVAGVVGLASWADRAPCVAAALYGILFGAVLYPLYANWVWGGGWLAHLGQTRGYGHGMVDFAGATVVNAGPGLAAFGAWLALARKERAAPPTEPSPVPVLGLGLAVVGYAGATAASTYVMTDTRLAIAATNIVVAGVAGALMGLLYTWFAAGEPHPAVGAQAGLAGLVACSAGAPFFPSWAAAVVGGVAGLLVPIAGHVLGWILHDHNGGAVVAVHGLGGVWGALAVGLMADGSYGIGWNGVGEREYLGIAGQGVTGQFPALGAAADPGQFSAQVVGVIVLLAYPIITWLVVRTLRWLCRG